ncbi:SPOROCYTELESS-like EAR-containing protein 1 [Heracleum sosnowskyi]|uniref:SPOROCYTELESS-like EAR-containing protein 1 n=1 Tax=Heracleum sosnowskyi TaxID=360622 RepID=A0AAD8HFT7_9APIA|nr:SPOROCYTELESS-like EAR-containing protein 1 [Heracleum sosnowskyi]
MGSNYFGEPNLRNEKYGGGGGGGSSSSSSSSRKGKKKSGNNSEKPKQPQRGLGVAQLEKIRLDSQMAVAAGYNINPDSINPSYPMYFPNPQEDLRVERPYIRSSPSSFYTSTLQPSLASYGFDAPQTPKMMGKGERERTYVSYGDHSQPSLINTRWNAGKTDPSIQHSQQSQFITKQLLDLEAEEATGKNKKARGDSVGSGSTLSGSCNSEELDLELRLSL